MNLSDMLLVKFWLEMFQLFRKCKEKCSFSAYHVKKIYMLRKFMSQQDNIEKKQATPLLSILFKDQPVLFVVQ
jgi:hypothetical protein